MEKTVFSWLQIDQMIDNIRDKILEKNSKRTPTFIGITNGGVIPAMLLTKRINYSGFTTINSRRFSFPNELRQLNHFNDIIIVDDISDTGETIDHLIKNLDFFDINYNTAVLIDKCNSKTRIDYPGLKLKNNNWIVFPWENKDEQTKRNRDV